MADEHVHPHRRKNDRGWHRVWRENGYRDLWLVIVSVIVLAVSVIGWHENAQRLKDTNALVHEINGTADRALVQATLVHEKVCSLSNQGMACRALFDRLARNLSQAQRKRLGCDVIAVLDGPGIREIRKASRCPKPIPAP